MTESVHIHESLAKGRLAVTVTDAINDEHAISLAAHKLTAEGFGDAELRGVAASRAGNTVLVYDFKEAS